MSTLPADFRLAYSGQIKEGYASFGRGGECPYLKGTPDRTAWRYGWDWADRRAAGPAWVRPTIRRAGRPTGPVPEIAGPSDESPDYDIRGQDIETRLVGAITETIIDAARLASNEHRNGFPNFAMYRLLLAQDRCYLPLVRQWWVLFSIEWCRQHMRSGFSAEIATVAAWDSLQRVMDPARPILVAEEVAAELGISRNTYLHARNNLREVLRAALKCYWEWLEIGYRVVKKLERKVF